MTLRAGLSPAAGREHSCLLSSSSVTDARRRQSTQRSDGCTRLKVRHAAATAAVLQPDPRLDALPDALLHHVMLMLEPSDMLRLRAVSRGLAAAVRTLPGCLFAKLSIVLPDGSPDTERCGARESAILG